MSVDVLAIGAHPDDVELGVGGTLLRLAEDGYRVGILDLTLGELSSRGTIEERMKEAQDASERLQVSIRHNAELPDGGLQNTPEQRLEVIPFIRMLKPKILLLHRKNDRHPDHRIASELARDANFFAGVSSIVTEEAPYRADHVYYYNPYTDDQTPPQVVMDISPVFAQKMDALSAYHSQFHNPNYAGAETLVASESFWAGIEKRAAYWGNRIGVEYGEPLYREGPMGIAGFSELEENA
ncbi:MAG: bacillithiol biosynthesis deacetylase BshB1 [Candidatus Hydrogenedentota bacterium]